jgi:hypothetical protein
MGVDTIKSTFLHLHLHRPFYSTAKSEVVIPRRKFQFASFFEHFEGVPFFSSQEEKQDTCLYPEQSVNPGSNLFV